MTGDSFRIFEEYVALLARVATAERELGRVDHYLGYASDVKGDSASERVGVLVARLAAAEADAAHWKANYDEQVRRKQGFRRWIGARSADITVTEVEPS